MKFLFLPFILLISYGGWIYWKVNEQKDAKLYEDRDLKRLCSKISSQTYDIHSYIKRINSSKSMKTTILPIIGIAAGVILILLILLIIAIVKIKKLCSENKNLATKLDKYDKDTWKKVVEEKQDKKENVSTDDSVPKKESKEEIKSDNEGTVQAHTEKEHKETEKVHKKRTQYLKAGRNEPFFWQGSESDPNGAYFKVTYYDDDKKHEGRFSIITDISNIKTMEESFRKLTIKIVSKGILLQEASSFTEIPNSGRLKLEDNVWTIKNPIEIKLKK